MKYKEVIINMSHARPKNQRHIISALGGVAGGVAGGAGAYKITNWKMKKKLEPMSNQELYDFIISHPSSYKKYITLDYINSLSEEEIYKLKEKVAKNLAKNSAVAAGLTIGAATAIGGNNIYKNKTLKGIKRDVDKFTFLVPENNPKKLIQYHWKKNDGNKKKEAVLQVAKKYGISRKDIIRFLRNTEI